MVVTAGERVNGAARHLQKPRIMPALLETPRIFRDLALAALGLGAVALQPRSEPARGTQLLFAFHAAGAEYVRLADDELPAHAPPRLIEQDGLSIAIADVAPRELPTAERAWLGRRVRVDASCDATVTGFAVVARLAGDPVYAGRDDLAWTADGVLANGQVMLAARLDGCTGSYARDAALADPVAPVALADPVLALRARAIALASDPVRAAQREWQAMGRSGWWYDDAAASVTTEVFRHPKTGARWVMVHATIEHDCADPAANVLALFRVAADGELVPVQVRALSLETIERLIDVDGDGSWELIGRPWLGLDRVLESASGEELDRIAVPLFGCPC